jgi:hypothetical protein
MKRAAKHYRPGEDVSFSKYKIGRLDMELRIITVYCEFRWKRRWLKESIG